MAEFKLDAREQAATHSSGDEDKQTARGLYWLRSNKPKWAARAPVAKVTFSLTLEELEKLLEEAKEAGGVNLRMSFWASKYPETSCGWSSSAPEVDDYVPQKRKPEEAGNVTNVTDVVI